MSEEKTPKPATAPEKPESPGTVKGATGTKAKQKPKPPAAAQPAKPSEPQPETPQQAKPEPQAKPESKEGVESALSIFGWDL